MVNKGLRRSGLPVLGDIAWATHFCQFYQTKQDLFDILIPFLQAGLESNEFCVWVTSDMLTREEAVEALRGAILDGDKYMASGQLEIFPYSEWYIRDGIFDSRLVLDNWTEKLDKALKKGYEGARVTGDTMWLEKEHWRDFMAYESAINDVIEGQKLIILCTYSLARCGASEIIDVIVRHESALIRKEGNWEVIETEEQKRISHALKQSESIARDRLAEIEAYYQNAPVGLCVLDRDLRFKRINQRLADFDGVPIPDHMGKSLCEIVPALAEQARKITSRILAIGKPVENVEFSAETPSLPGVRRTWSGSWHPLFDGRGEVTGFSVVIEEVTERKQAEEILVVTNRKVAEILESIQDGFFTVDRDWRFVYVNTRAAANSGFNPKDLLGENLWEKFPGILGTSHEEAYRAAMASREIRRFETQGVLTEGWYSITAYPSSEGISVYWQDIGDRKKAEESLRRHAERLDLISNTASNLLATDNPQAIIEDLCRKVMDHLDCHVFFNYLVDEKTNRLSLNAYAGVASKVAREIASLEFGAALCGCAARDGCRIVAEHIPMTPDPRADLVRSFGVKAYAAHPLFARGKVIGTLSFGTKSRLTFSEDELSLMKTVTDQVATAMERKHLLEATRERADDLEARVRERTVELSRQAALLDLAYDAVIVRTMDGKVRFWSSGAEATYGFTREEAVGKPIDDLIHTIFPVPFRAIMDIIARDERWEGELVHTRKDGGEIVVLSRWALRKGSEDQPPEILEINRDISERKRSEELISRVNTYNRSLLETSLDPLVTISPEGKITDVNEATIKATGTSRERLIGTDFSDYFTEPDKAREGYEQVFEKGYVTNYPLTIRNREGHLAHVLYNASLYRDASGEARGVFAAARDVTALRQAAGYARNLLEASLDPLVTISPEGKISDVNSATEQVTGYARTELIDTDFSDYFTVPQKARAGYRAVFDEGYVRDYPLEIRHRDGHVTPVLYNASVYRDDTGSVIGVFASARDMTGQRQLEAQLRQSQKMDALGTLAGGIAHDFNNILAAIIGFSELVQDELPHDAREKRHIERVLQAGIRGRELVRQMLTFSRQTEQEAKPLQLGSVVKETMKLLRASIPTTISIRVDVKSGSGFVLADPVQMQQIIMNLCTNAAHAMREKGGILDVQLSDFSVNESGVKGLKPGPYMKLVVHDSGVGIAPEHMERIFDPFFTTKKLGEGTGLGLAMVHGIVHQHGGSIMAESEPGKGSAFTVYLPKIVDAPQPAKARETDLAIGYERILLVDDEEALVEMGKELLMKLGYEVTARRNSREALALFRLDPARFDLVLTDQTMPEMTGLELAREIKAVRPDMPVILNTGFSHLVDAETARNAGIDAFAMKPLTKKEIARTVRKVLDEVGRR